MDLARIPIVGPALHAGADVVRATTRLPASLASVATELDRTRRELVEARQAVLTATARVDEATATLREADERAAGITAAAERLERTGTDALARMHEIDETIDEALDVADQVPGITRPADEEVTA